jgi:hypothetical protein
MPGVVDCSIETEFLHGHKSQSNQSFFVNWHNYDQYLLQSQKLFQSACKEFRESDEVLELWLIMTKQFSKDENLMNDLFKLCVPVQSSAGEKVKIMHLDHVFASKGESLKKPAILFLNICFRTECLQGIVPKAERHSTVLFGTARKNDRGWNAAKQGWCQAGQEVLRDGVWPVWVEKSRYAFIQHQHLQGFNVNLRRSVDGLCEIWAQSWKQATHHSNLY